MPGIHVATVRMILALALGIGPHVAGQIGLARGFRSLPKLLALNFPGSSRQAGISPYRRAAPDTAERSAGTAARDPG
jgi:hypothetical protein